MFYINKCEKACFLARRRRENFEYRVLLVKWRPPPGGWGGRQEQAENVIVTWSQAEKQPYAQTPTHVLLLHEDFSIVASSTTGFDVAEAASISSCFNVAKFSELARSLEVRL